MIAGLVAHGQHLNRRDQFLAEQREFGPACNRKAVAALLRSKSKREG